MLFSDSGIAPLLTSSSETFTMGLSSSVTGSSSSSSIFGILRISFPLTMSRTSLPDKVSYSYKAYKASSLACRTYIRQSLQCSLTIPQLVINTLVTIRQDLLDFFIHLLLLLFAVIILCALFIENNLQAALVHEYSQISIQKTCHIALPSLEQFW